MFRTFARIFLPNPLDWKLKRCANRGGKKILLGWNRGLGDIPLGLYAIVHRIRTFIPDAKITFLTRQNLKEGFSLLEGVDVLIAPDWKRGESYDVKKTLFQMGIDKKSFDLIIEAPSPSDWVRWQRGKIVPKLKWDPNHDDLWKKFGLSEEFTYIGVQVVAETNYGLWRNWPLDKWKEFFDRLEKFKNIKVLLFGYGDHPQFSNANLIDLRGKTNLFDLLSIIKNRCKYLILPDSGILSMSYYLDESFSIQIISLWGDPNHGILKQAVPSPNPKLVHSPMIGKLRDLSSVSAEEVIDKIFPVKPLYKCTSFKDAVKGDLKNVGAIILAGGQGSRLGIQGPKGTFEILGKSLFQWICEKAPKENFPIAVMTSPINHNETVDFFAKKGNFEREIYFFQQEMLPLLDENKQPTQILGPNGNGSVYKAFQDSKLADVFLKKGIDLVTVVPVENPLADPADLALIGHLRSTKSEIAIKCVEREMPNESMGALVERMGEVEIVEYLNLDPNLEIQYSNTGMLAISFPFFLKMSQRELPLHWVQKKIPGTEKTAWKREKFIFSAFPYGKVTALCYPRHSCYAPLKNSSCLASVESLLSKHFIPVAVNQPND